MANIFSVVNQELNEEVNGFRANHGESEVRAAEKVWARMAALRDSGMVGLISQHSNGSTETAVAIAIGFGMRVQRKISNPEKVTSYQDELDSYEIATGVKNAHTAHEDLGKVPPTI